VYHAIVVLGGERRKLLGCAAGIFLGRPQKSDLQPAADRGHQRRHEIGAVQVCWKGCSMQPARRDVDTDAIRQDHEPVERIGKFVIRASHVCVVRVEKADRGELPVGEILSEQFERVLPADRQDWNAQDIHGRQLRGERQGGLDVHSAASR
jgi:hypothetical protein